MLQSRPSPFKGMKMTQMTKVIGGKLAPVTAAGVNQTTVPVSVQESQRNYQVAADWNGRNYNGLEITRVVLPNDVPPQVRENDDRIKYIQQAQAARQAEWNRQASMPWGSHFMPIEATAGRLNNPAQASFVKQRQLAPPNTYGQFYAFMHAMAAAFGNVQGG